MYTSDIECIGCMQGRFSVGRDTELSFANPSQFHTHTRIAYFIFSYSLLFVLIHTPFLSVFVQQCRLVRVPLLCDHNSCGVGTVATPSYRRGTGSRNTRTGSRSNHFVGYYYHDTRTIRTTVSSRLISMRTVRRAYTPRHSMSG